MLDRLLRARKLADAIRFSGDERCLPLCIEPAQLIAVRNSFYQNGLEISEKTTPTIWRSLSQVCERLQIPPEAVKAFVYASPEAQAECFSGSESECVIRLTSGLVELLHDDELTFVIGHELGHFLLSHNGANHDKSSTDHSLRLQAQEISADRLGLISCVSVEVAMKALMKTVSGLGSRHLKFNVSEFIGQLNKVAESGTSPGDGGTHPPMVLRGKALLWFSMADAFKGLAKHQSSVDLTKVDSKVLSDLTRDMDQYLMQFRTEAKDNLTLWLAALRVIEAGSFSKVRQAQVADLLGTDTLERLKSYLGNLSHSEAKESTEKKVREAEAEIEKLDPKNHKAECINLRKKVAAAIS